MAKQQIRISIDKELYEEAKELGLNLSRTCERAIERRVAALRVLDAIKDLEAAE